MFFLCFYEPKIYLGNLLKFRIWVLYPIVWFARLGSNICSFHQYSADLEGSCTLRKSICAGKLICRGHAAGWSPRGQGEEPRTQWGWSGGPCREWWVNWGCVRRAPAMARKGVFRVYYLDQGWSSLTVRQCWGRETIPTLEGKDLSWANWDRCLHKQYSFKPYCNLLNLLNVTISSIYKWK